MHYYKRNIGDYAKKAARLTMLQHGAYTVLMDACYDREEFPTLEQAIDWCWASTQEEIDAVAFVLKKFFTLTDGVYVQERIQEELARYHENAATNKRIAKEREAKRRENSTNRAQSVNEPPPNHKPITTNQEPVTNINNMVEAEFDRFWQAGMVKSKKQQAFAAFKKIAKKQKDLTTFVDQLVFDIQWRLENQQLGFDNLHPTTYLNNERWNDERRPNQNYQRSGDSLASQSEQQTRIIQAKIAAGEFDQRPMGSNGATLPLQVEQSGRPEDGEQPIDAEFYPLVSENGGAN